MQKLDQGLSLKCNKSVLHATVHELKESCLSNEGARVLKDKIKETAGLIWQWEANIEQTIEEHRRNLEEQVSVAVDQRIQDKLEAYEAVANQFRKLFNTEDISQQIEKKADIAYVQELEQSRCNMRDLEEIEAKMEEYESKMRHVTVFTSELANILLPEKLSCRFTNQDDLNRSIKRREEVIQQGKYLTNWIMKSASSESLNPKRSKMSLRENSYSPKISLFLPAEKSNLSVASSKRQLQEGPQWEQLNTCKILKKRGHTLRGMKQGSTLRA